MTKYKRIEEREPFAFGFPNNFLFSPGVELPCNKEKNAITTDNQDATQREKVYLIPTNDTRT
jgi:hypothetical protein